MSKIVSEDQLKSTVQLTCKLHLRVEVTAAGSGCLQLAICMLLWHL